MRLSQTEKQQNKKRVIIVGGGFAGLNAAYKLANQDPFQVILIDQRNHHLFQPLLYQVATAGLNPADIAVPIRAQFSKAENIEVHLGKITGVRLKERTLVSDKKSNGTELKYDYLILACGAQHSYYSHPEWEEAAPGLKTLEQAIEIRRRILLAFERAENELDPKAQAALLTFVIVGAGPTGVELAGAISDISNTVLIKDFRRIDPKSAKVILLEAGPRILTSFPEELSQRALRDLADLRVEVRTSARVENITSEGVQVGKDFIMTKSVFWAAGVQVRKIDFQPPVNTDPAGRIFVNADFSIPKYPEVFVIGDMAAFEWQNGKFLPGLAPVAIQAGRYVGKTILKESRGEARNSFKFLDKGQMATIGKKKAIGQFRNIKMVGYFAWLAWLFVHVFYLIDFKNRISVISQWIWNYVFSKRGSRLITDKDWKLKN